MLRVACVVLLSAIVLAQSPAEQQLRTINKQYQAQVLAKDYDGAIENITRMLDIAAAGNIRVNRGQMLYARACFNALTDRKERAISDAKAAVNAGFTDYNAFANDPDLASVRDEPEFKAFFRGLNGAGSAQASPPAAKNDAQVPKPAEAQQAVIVHLKTAARATKQIAALAEKLKSAIAEASAGEFAGVEIGDGESTLYMNGADAELLYKAIAPSLRAFRPARGSYLVKRYGEAGAKEVRVALSAAK